MVWCQIKVRCFNPTFPLLPLKLFYSCCCFSNQVCFIPFFSCGGCSLPILMGMNESWMKISFRMTLQSLICRRTPALKPPTHRDESAIVFSCQEAAAKDESQGCSWNRETEASATPRLKTTGGVARRGDWSTREKRPQGLPPGTSLVTVTPAAVLATWKWRDCEAREWRQSRTYLVIQSREAPKREDVWSKLNMNRSTLSVASG